jgi:hypothetical protein
MSRPAWIPAMVLATRRRGLMTARVLLGLCSYCACSNGGDSGSVGTGGSAPATGGGAGGVGGATGTGGSLPGSGGTGVGGSMGSTGGTSGSSAYPNLGVCGRRIQATADATSFDGYEERYLLGNGGLDGPGSEVCIVRFDLKRVGDAPGPCADCAWAHLLEYSNPTMVTDADGVCAKSDLGLDAAAIAKVAGSRVGLGFAMHYGGAHASARLTYNAATGTWEISGNANWSETSKAFKSDYREGFCNYGP